MCKGNKLIGDYCDEDHECLTEYCNSSTHRCVSQERTEKSRIFGGGDGEGSAEDTRERESERRVVEIKNVVMVASIIAFVAIAALFVKCVQR